MDAKKRIGLTLRMIETKEYRELRDGISHDWIKLIEEWGYLPVLVPNILKDAEDYFVQQCCDALFLTNGEDVRLIREDGGRFDGTQRDVTEANLLRYALGKRIPVVGVCRGMQFINVYFGGVLTQGLVSHTAKPHSVDIVDENFKNFYSTDVLKVNSYHSMGILRDNLAPCLVPWAVCGDVIEAFYHRDFPIMAIQWHPERDPVIGRRDRKSIGTFIGEKSKERSASA